MQLPFLVLTHILVLLLQFIYYATASPSPSPYAAPAVISLPSRQSRPASRVARGQATIAAAPHPTSDVEHDLLPFVIVSTIDGALHAIDRDTGKVRWTLRDGVEPLVGGGIKGRGGDENYIVEPQGGGLYVFEEEGNGEEEDGETRVRKLPLSVDQLIELSPFTFPHSPSRIFTGSKSSSLLTIDLRNGQQLNCFSSFASNKSAEECICENDQLLDDMDSRSRSNRDVLFVGRTDYRLTIHAPVSGHAGSLNTDDLSATREEEFGTKEGKRRFGSSQSSAQEIAYSTYTPNSFDKPLADLWATMGQTELYDDDGSQVKRMRVELRHDGAAIGVESGTGARWSVLLGSPGIAVYDILLPLTPAHANPILVPQPPPHLPSLFPRPSKPLPPHLDFLNKPPTTYIGQVPQIPLIEAPPIVEDPASTKAAPRASAPTSQARPLFYALSSSRYPLINLAPPPRPGAYANGTFLLSEDLTERDQLLPYLLDPPNETTTARDAVATRTPGDLVDANQEYLQDGKPGKPWTWFNVLGAGILLLGSAIAGVVWRKRQTSRALVPVPPVKDEKSESDDSKTEQINEKTPLLGKQIMDQGTGSHKASSTRDTARPTAKKSVTFAKEAPDAEVRSRSSSESNSGKSPNDGENAASDITEGQATPKKKSTRRRVRGKKKPKGILLDGGEEGDDGDDGDDSMASANAAGGKDREKPLPELPREMSAVDLTAASGERNDTDGDDKERLSISDTVIGFGSHGTVVLKGTWGNRAVAVKRLLSDFTRLASQEVKLLQASDDHPNVIRYYCQERRDNFLYIALDLCQASLADLIECPDKHIELASVLDRKKALKEISGGLRHLHGMKIIHRDIKPQNVLVSCLKDGSLRMLVSDFGLARRLEQDQSSFAPTANNLAGSLGWRAPECIRGQVRLHDGGDRFSSSSTSSVSSLPNESGDEKTPALAGANVTRLTKAVDLFALGCLYFWVLMSGQHPYGEVYDRESNIVKGEAVAMDKLDFLGEEGVEAKELIGDLLSMDPTKRPETSDCLVHPFFWTPAKRLAFLCDASDRFEILNHDPPEPPIVSLEATAVDVVGKDWFSRADKVFTSNLGKYRKYKGGSVRDLLRAMRNKIRVISFRFPLKGQKLNDQKHHYQDLEPSAQRHFGTLPAGFLNYFTSRYPRLFLHVYAVIKESRLRHESMFEGYFQEG